MILVKALLPTLGLLACFVVVVLFVKYVIHRFKVGS